MITQDAGICFGQPVFAGTRIPVAVVKSRLQAGHSPQELLSDYPTLTAAMISAVDKDTRQAGGVV